jgi:hypothetical protein
LPKWVDWRLHNTDASLAALVREQWYASQSRDISDGLKRVGLA